MKFHSYKKTIKKNCPSPLNCYYYKINQGEYFLEFCTSLSKQAKAQIPTTAPLEITAL